jgi:hypothetical protein
MSDGTVDATFNGLGSIPSSTVRDIARQSSGKYIIVGDFGVARLNTTGTRCCLCARRFPAEHSGGGAER